MQGKLERFIESKYLSQGENTAPSADLTSFNTFAASTSAKVETVNVKASSPEGGNADATRPWRLQCYRSRGVLDDGSHLRLYFLQAADFVEPHPAAGETRIEALGDKRFLQRTPKELLAVYQKVSDR